MTNSYFYLAGGSNGWVADSTSRPNFTVTSEGVVLNQWGVKPPTPLSSSLPTNRTLLPRLKFSGYATGTFLASKKVGAR